MLTLASARRALWSYGSNVPYETASVNDLAQFDFKLMQVVERFFTLGTFRNMWRRLDLTVYGCRLTIPRGFDTCRMVSACGNAAPLYSQFHRFAGCGVAVDPVGAGCNGTGLRLVDEAAQTFVIPDGTFTLRAVATEINADGLSLIGGVDADGNELFGQITLALANGATNTTQEFTGLPEIQKAVTTHAVLLYAVDVDTAVATLISAFSPGETIPAYRQYEVEGICSTDDGTDPVVSAICKLAFTPAVADADLVIPGMVGALKLGLQAREFEDRVDRQNAKAYWQDAIDLLDSELSELQSAEQPSIQFDQFFGCGSVRSAR